MTYEDLFKLLGEPKGNVEKAIYASDKLKVDSKFALITLYRKALKETHKPKE